ncbi:bacterial regulatory helix-turn-helix protein, AraC family protein 37 [Achromobacter xylosoxidans A8]|uniref:Bacterial regulatory helix-turn-helix protein, AraC family protein 37 n=1 Tax=Achromobacter xylosoxidans (strain A8) TaxID=762376 RepID=E3HHF1_ACHXA|nr:helix-turn-helix domain-containing protein [Achromobacter xylosoxidans]ADP19101.1 bacterial regulatory helix-turn-helix protein, AraC family protein 37 [Achromobacter xylosoxidans A8]
MGAAPDNYPLHVDLLQPAGRLNGPVHAAIDTFRTANGIARSRSGQSSGHVVTWSCVYDPLMAAQEPEAEHLCFMPPGAPDRAMERAILVPPLETVSVPQLRASVASNEAVLREIRGAVADGRYVCAIGTGVWLVAAAGVLDKMQAPVQWAYQSGFARAHPDLAIANDPIVWANERILLAGTPSLAYDCVLELMERTGIAGLAGASRDKLVFDPARQFIASTLPIEKVSGLTRDSPLYRAAHWLLAHAQEAVTIGDAAQHAAVSERTLARLFRMHLAITPHEFLTDIRMRKSQMWLEVTLRSVEDIANDCGYLDVAAFRRAFKRKFGLTPADYRREYTQRGPRARWKMERYGSED